ncbi:MAG: class I SAM-dependent methyltransferase [Anaerolineaceae bacterium]|nr:class I SAM-dependent methyltransferase [Anaerolineaceae bacterium]
MMEKKKGISYGQSYLSLIDHITLHLRLKKVVKILKGIPNIETEELNVIELGCGYKGDNIQKLAKRYPKALFDGIDLQVNPETHRFGLNLISGDITNWQGSKQYDIVLSLAVIEHLINPLQHLQLIHQLLKPEGIAVLTSPTPESHFLWNVLKSLCLIDNSLGNEHIIYLTKRGIVQLSQKAGLRIAKLRNFEVGLNQIVVFTREKEV